MSGRGRGMNNAPAWMTRGDFRGDRGMPHHHEEQHDDFGRLPRDHPDSRLGPPPPPMDRGHHHPSPPPNNGRGPGPRGPYDDRYGGGRYDDRGGRYSERDRDRDRHHHHHHHHHNSHHRGGPPPPDPGRPFGRGRGGPPPPRRPPPPPPPGKTGNGGITFRSFEEERDWVAERRRKRLARKSKFDAPPTPQQLATDAAVLALSNPAATDFAGIPSDRNFAAVPQQTRHARRLYIGHLPPNVTEEELHVFFREAIQLSLVQKSPDTDDPILSVYINHERRFCFLEFKTVEMATACLALDGIDIRGKGKVKVKRPNDYNPAMAPKVHPSAIPELDVSKLGIISGTVQDGPNKIFIGGLHYHLTEDQVLELLQAFGKVKAFHLVKNDPDSITSKGYCFVEYSDPNVTQVAVLGLNGMDLGSGKILTARVAGERAGVVLTPLVAPSSVTSAAVPTVQAEMPAVHMRTHHSAPLEATSRPDAVIITGYDVEALVDAAMGLREMPTAPMHVDQFGVPITSANTTLPTVAPLLPPPPPPPPLQQQTPQFSMIPAQTALPPGSSALEIANAALDAAFGAGSSSNNTNLGIGLPTQASGATRILVLYNMVTDEDLATDDDYGMLVEEVRGECAKYGKLLSMEIPRTGSQDVNESAVKKIFLEYATVADATTAERELAGRQFGANVVKTSYFPEGDFLNGKLR